MNTRNAWGFLFCGLGMFLGPFLDPSHFPAGTIAGVASELWLEFMGWVNVLLGGGYLVLNRLAAILRRAPAWKSEREPEANNVLRPAWSDQAEAEMPARRPAAA